MNATLSDAMNRWAIFVCSSVLAVVRAYDQYVRVLVRKVVYYSSAVSDLFLLVLLGSLSMGVSLGLRPVL